MQRLPRFELRRLDALSWGKLLQSQLHSERLQLLHVTAGRFKFLKGTDGLLLVLSCECCTRTHARPPARTHARTQRERSSGESRLDG